MTWEYKKLYNKLNYIIYSLHLRFTSGAAILNFQLRVEWSGQSSEKKPRPACAFRLKKKHMESEYPTSDEKITCSIIHYFPTRVTYKVRDPYRTVRFGTHVIHRTSDLKGTVAHKYLPRDPQIWTIPVEFSPNPNQTHPSMLIRVSKIIKITDRWV